MSYGQPTPGNRIAVLAGNDRQPEMRLYFDRTDRHLTNGDSLVNWVKKAPRRHWDRALGCWVITAFGGTDKNPRDPERVLAKAGFTVVIDHPELDPSLHGTLSLLDLVDPMCRQSAKKPTIALVRPRFAGWDVCREILGFAAVWDRETGRFEVPLTELLVHGEPKKGLIIDPTTLAAAREQLLKKPTFGSDKHDDETLAADAATLAYSTGINLSDADQEQIDRLVETVGDVPDWFGMDPFPYQRLGAIAACAGRNLIADPTGLGKTLQGIAALSIKDVDRAVIVVPPVVVTHWGREVERCGLATFPPKPLSKAARKRAERAAKRKVAASSGKTTTFDTEPRLADPLAPPNVPVHGAGESIVAVDQPTTQPDAAGSQKPPRHIVVFKAGRKEPELPERGVVVIPDSLLTSRPETRQKIAAWNPDGLVYDEAHRARNWKSARAQAVRDLCAQMRPDALRLPMTATPLFSNPAELASLLAISGHLDPVFGGYTAFTERYCKRNHFNQLVPRLDMLDELKQILEERVWVRRRKDEVLKDLPKVMSTASYLDVDLGGFRAAHNEVIEKISLWLDAFVAENDAYPDDDTVKEYAKQQIGLMSPLRKAAGVAKVPHALEYISDWIDNEVSLNADGTFTVDRPLLVWAHHQEVIDAMLEHAANHLKESAKTMVGVIAGGTSQNQIRQRVDAFQEGRLAVLICSITAAGVGITLTRGSDQLHLESDFSPPLVSQAIDRQNRIGQTKPVNVNFLLAEGTFDARIHEILQRKGGVISQVTGDDEGDVSPVDLAAMGDSTAPWEIIADLAAVAIADHPKRKAKAGAAA